MVLTIGGSMVTKNGIDYNGVWELDGKIFTLAESSVTDWDPVYKGTELWNEDGRGYVEVEYNALAPFWSTEQVRPVNDMRHIIRLMLKEKFKAIRMIQFSKDDNDVLSVVDIQQFDDLDYLRKGYPYGSYIDATVQEWGDTLMCFEGIKFDDGYCHE